MSNIYLLKEVLVYCVIKEALFLTCCALWSVTVFFHDFFSFFFLSLKCFCYTSVAYHFILLHLLFFSLRFVEHFVCQCLLWFILSMVGGVCSLEIGLFFVWLVVFALWFILGLVGGLVFHNSSPSFVLASSVYLEIEAPACSATKSWPVHRLCMGFGWCSPCAAAVDVEENKHTRTCRAESGSAQCCADSGLGMADLGTVLSC